MRSSVLAQKILFERKQRLCYNKKNSKPIVVVRGFADHLENSIKRKE